MLNALPRPRAADVEAAACALEGVALRTPCLPSPSLRRHTGAHVVLKYENRQHTGSYKMRGAHVKLAGLTPAERERGAIAASAGNHAQGVAYCARRLGVASTIVMPETTPYCKIRNTESYGAEVILHGTTVADAFEEARRIGAERGLTYIAPFDDPDVVAGAGTVGLEMMRAVSDIEVLLVQVGGGGLIGGVALAAKSVSPAVQVIGVQTELYPALYNATHGLPPPTGGATLAEGVAVARIGELNASLAADLVDDVLLVDEETLEFAVHLMLEEEKTVVEGAGAVGVAGLLRHRERFAGRRVGIVLSGGNIDTGLLAYVISRVRVREKRVVCLRAEMLDVPGGLARISDAIARAGANVLEVSHRRMFPNVLAKHMQLDLTLELRRPNDVHDILSKIRALGFTATIPKEEFA